MRKWVTLLLLWGVAWPAMAAKTLSIGQMEQLLAKLHGKPDGKVAGELDDVQLTERVSLARFTRWEAEFPGPRAHEQLMKLADLSAFLNPPAADVIPDPPPDAETEERMLGMAVQYVRSTMSRLPDFFATRDTTHFENTLSQRADYSAPETMARTVNAPLSGIPTQTAGMATGITEYRALHNTGEYSATVTYRDGKEVPNEDADKRKKEAEAALGLTSQGEFGPILTQVIGDVEQTGVSWLRWEQVAGEPVAEFHFAVPAGVSHFRVEVNVGGHEQELYPAYMGDMEVDPATGEILRLSEWAETTKPLRMRAAIAVEYAPVTIGDHSYICPVRGVAFSMVPTPGTGAQAGGLPAPQQAKLNDVVFTHYHEFGSEAHIVANPSGNGGVNVAGGNGAQTAENTAQGGAPAAGEGANAPVRTANGSPGTTPAPAATAMAEATPAPNPASVSAQPPAASPAGPASAEASSETPVAAPAAAQPAEAAANETTPPETGNSTVKAPITGPVFHAQSKLVLVDVTVTDHNHPVTGLDQKRFHVFEDGKEQEISSFEEKEPPASIEIAKPPALPPNTYSNVPVYPETDTVNVLLLDALNTPLGDQQYVRQQMLSYLKTVNPGTSMAIFTLSSRLQMATGFTTDLAKLAQALENKKAAPRSAADVGAGEGESMSSSLSQLASSMANANDPLSAWLVGMMQSASADSRSYENNQRANITIDALSGLARYLAAIPGKKNLIWFSGSFPIFVGPEALQNAALKNVSDYSDAMRRMDALLTAARVAVYPVSAGGVPTVANADSTSVPAPVNGMNNPGPSVAAGNAGSLVQRSLDQDAMNAIAADTGGQAYTTGNDLKAAVDRIMANDSSYYALSYVPPEETGSRNAKQFHTIEVKVDGAKYQLAYRRGYYPEQPVKAATPASAVPAAVTDAAQLGAPPATQILFQARVLPEGDPAVKGTVPDPGPPSKALASAKGGFERYVVDLGINPQGMTFTDGPAGAKHTQLECVLEVYGTGGAQLNQVGRVLDFSVSPAQYAQLLSVGKEFPVRLAVDLPVGADVVRAVVYDPSSARIGSLEIPLQVAGKQAGAQANSSSQ